MTWILPPLPPARDIETREVLRKAAAMTDYKRRIRKQYPQFYSQDLISSLFMHPYTKIALIQRDIGVSRLTASKRLDLLSASGFLRKRKVGRSNYYVNTTLFDILTQPEGAEAAP